MTERHDKLQGMSEIRHGYSLYTRRPDGCRCDVCRAANAAYHHTRRQQRAAEPLPRGVRHGKASTYVNYLCRCERCRQAWADYTRQLRSSTTRKAG